MSINGSSSIDEELLACPITLRVMDDPVLCDDGHLYEREAIEKWLQQSNISPVTRQPVRGRLTKAFSMKAIIDAWRRCWERAVCMTA